MKVENESGMQRILFKDKENVERTNPLAALTFAVEYAQAQSSNQGGIALTFVVENTSSNEISIANPLEVLRVLMVDSIGYPISLPQGSAPRVLVNQAGSSYQLRLPFQVSNVTRGNSSTSLEGESVHFEIDSENISYPGNSTTRYPILITAIRNQRPADRPAEATFNAPTPDNYRINLLLPVISRQAETAHRNCETGYFDVNYS